MILYSFAPPVLRPSAALFEATSWALISSSWVLISQSDRWCCVVWGTGAPKRVCVEFPDPARPKANNAAPFGSVCARRQLQVSLVPSVTPPHCRTAPRPVRNRRRCLETWVYKLLDKFWIDEAMFCEKILEWEKLDTNLTKLLKCFSIWLGYSRITFSPLREPIQLF